MPVAEHSARLAGADEFVGVSGAVDDAGGGGGATRPSPTVGPGVRDLPDDATGPAPSISAAGEWFVVLRAVAL
jgi:hypothetical protein